MSLDLSTATDVLSALAILLALTLSYGSLKRLLRRESLARAVLGSLFGAVAGLLIALPIPVLPGISVDLHSVPLVLAGAFMGWRGLVPCLLIAGGMRLGIGGIGTTSALAAMGYSGLVGLFWGYTTVIQSGHQGRAQLLWLGILAATNVWAVVLLPVELARGFLTHVAPTVMATHIVLIPLFAALMRRAEAALWIERQFHLTASTDEATGLLTFDTFKRLAAASPRSDEGSDGTALVLLRIRHRAQIERLHGPDAIDLVLSTLRARLEKRLPREDLAARTPGGHVALLLRDLTRDEALRFVIGFGQAFLSRPIRLSDGGKIRVCLDVGETWTATRRP